MYSLLCDRLDNKTLPAPDTFFLIVRQKQRTFFHPFREIQKRIIHDISHHMCPVSKILMYKDFLLPFL